MILDWRGHNENEIHNLKYWGYKLQEINIEIDENDKIQDLIWHKLYCINFDSFNNNNLPIQSQIKCDLKKIY